MMYKYKDFEFKIQIRKSKDKEYPYVSRSVYLKFKGPKKKKTPHHVSWDSWESCYAPSAHAKTQEQACNIALKRTKQWLNYYLQEWNLPRWG